MENNQNKKTVNIVSHTHWDREWYFSLTDSILLSLYNFEQVIERLETDPEYKVFHLDGQTSIVENFLEYKPEYKDRIIKLVKDKRLYFGPWFAQTDSLHVEGESFIRNLYYGSKKANELGGNMKIGYLPDTFGHNAQTPQLFKGFGIDNVMFWRGFDPAKVGSQYFNWKSTDGTEILAVNLTFGYGGAHGFEMTKEEWDKVVIPMAEKNSKSTPYNNLLMPAGGDQTLINPNFPDKIKELNEYNDDFEWKLSSYEEFVNNLKEEIKDLSNLETYEGDFREPVRARVHRTIGSSRADVKMKSWQLEQKMINILEPLTVLFSKLANDNMINLSVIEKAWKLCLDGHSHDSLGGCNADLTNSNIIYRFNEAENLVDGTINFLKKSLGESIEEKHGKDVVVYNFESWKLDNEWRELTLISRSPMVELYDGENKLVQEVIDVEPLVNGMKSNITSKGEVMVPADPYYRVKLKIKVSIPAFGYKSFNIKNIEVKHDNPFVSGNSIENNDLRITIGKDNISLVNKLNNQEIKELIKLENVANDGDSYDFSPLENDTPITAFEITRVKTKTISESHKVITFKAKAQLPLELADRFTRSGKLVHQVFDFRIAIKDNKVDFKVDTTNFARDHRWRLLINTPINKNEVFTDIPFGYQKREWKVIPEDWNDTYVEKPLNYFPIINTFFKQDEEQTFVVSTKGMKEIEVVNDEVVALTLYRVNGWQGKENLVIRPLRASGMTLANTPEAQYPMKDLTFEFEMTFAKGKLTEDDVHKVMRNYNTRTDFYQVQGVDKFLNRLDRFEMTFERYDLEPEYSMFEQENLTLTSAYLSQHDKKPVFRFVNLNDEAQDTKLNIEGKLVNFNEEETEFESTLPKYRAITIK